MPSGLQAPCVTCTLPVAVSQGAIAAVGLH